MSISSALSLAEKVEMIVTAIETGEAFTNSNTALQVTAALAQIAGVTAVGGLVSASGRFTDPLVRLGAAIAGKSPELEAKGWLSGLVVAEALSRAIDEVNDRGWGADIIDFVVNDFFTAARNYVIPRRDPLVLDLDGDGLELIGATGTVLFDHNADGIKTGTGWAGRDDGLLVRDLNGNGLIDSGRELFGIDTLKANNTLAANGFDALKELDSNADGKITSADTAYAELKVWRDANQDGISQAAEMQSLSALGISSIGVNGTATGPQAGQVIAGNRVDLSTTFTQNGAVRTVGAIDFQVNNFYSQFSAQVVDQVGNPVAITAQALALPQMNGSGMVRNMQAAA